jgi:hypothetical protein
MSDPLFTLIHPETEAILAEVYSDHVKFYNTALERTLLLSGINIPSVLREQYDNKKIVFPRDASFSKAFIDIYYPFALHETGLILKEIKR